MKLNLQKTRPIYATKHNEVLSMKKKLLALLLICAMLLTGCGFIVVDDSDETAISSLLNGVAHGESADAGYSAADVQKRLKELGLLTGKADGIFGPRTSAALADFQKWCGISVTGEPDEATLALLFGDPAALPTPSPTPLSSGARDVEGVSVIKDLQTRLIELNYLHGKADGIFGSGTAKALRSFQEMNGLKATGEADEATLAALNRPNVVPMPTPEPTPRANGARGEDIKEIQTALQIMGFMGGNADGSFGTETENSVKRYQQYVHDREAAYLEAHPTPTPEPTPTLEPTAVIAMLDENGQAAPTIPPDEIAEEPEPAYEPDGIVTDELMADILSFNDVLLYQEDLQRGSKGGEVTRLQRRLASLWYLSGYGGIDGDFGSATEKALKYFQKRNHLEETGVADKDLQLLLFSSDAIKSDRPVCQYKIKVSVKDQRVYVYQWVNGDYTNLVRTMVCSTGTSANPTPKGTFVCSGACGSWYYFQKFDCWARYAYRITGGILFHSVLFSQRDESTLRSGSVAALGSRASHGCIRLKVDDARWIYNNCPSGTVVTIY